ncbi:dihydrofolate reductase family protein [Bacillus sp. SD088]|uniref:dihydrofolate reductase family protein n=1 Tax=Bacillus sp. SD088 TaxID=2782012 RepID=UPI001A967B83|nr:dihydrofolate reductase family protein [Bacillus sp. SD088]MBO0995999.1 dihydrofolate reductase [Bacillus sp. SD088]
MTDSRKVVLFIAVSLDGYIATKEESLEWLFKVEGEGDNGISEFLNTIDTILMGKTTYDWIMEHEGDNSWPYADKDCYVFTRSSIANTQQVKFISPNIPDFVNELKKQAGKNIWMVGGGELLSSFLKENAVDEFIITVAPTLIGSGIPLFKNGDYHLELSLKKTRKFNQFVELHYTVKK